ncbi:MAG: cytochrome [Deltaproteobacteria bacterium]|nr:cytochrome [Deltaproteobacteria bacterium]
MKESTRGIPRSLEQDGRDDEIAAGLSDPGAVLERILDAERRGALYPYYRRLRELAPIHRSEVEGLPPGTWFLTRAEDVNAVARSAGAVNDPRTAQVWDYEGDGSGAFYRMMSRAMLFLDKSDHDRVRRLVYKAFTPASVAPLGDLTARVAGELLDAVGDRDEIDFVRDFTYPLPLRAIMRLLGIPRDAEGTIERYAWDFARAGDPMSATSEIIERGNRAAEGLDAFFGEVFDLRERAPADDLVTALVHAQADGNRLGRDETIATLVLLLQAGHETTSDLLGNALIGLFQHPQALSRLAKNPDLVVPATAELLRYDTSVQISMRLARAPIELGKTQIPAGSLIALCYGAANRDPALHAEPDRLDLDRNPSHLSFSAGAYYCLGNALARTEIQAALGVLFRRAPGIRPASEGFVERWTSRLRGPLELPVSLG